MTEEEREHRKRMLVFAKRHAKNLGKDEPLTPEELAEAIKDLRRDTPRNFHRDFPMRIRFVTKDNLRVIVLCRNVDVPPVAIDRPDYT